MVPYMKHNLRFGLVLGQLAVLKTAQPKLKYASFNGHFFLNIVVSTLKNCIK